MPTFSTNPAPCVVSWNTRQCPPLGSTKTPSPLNDPSSTCWLITGIDFLYGQDIFCHIVSETKHIVLDLFQRRFLCMLRGFSPSTRLRFWYKLCVHPFVVSTTPTYLIFLPPLYIFWCWDRRWMAWLVFKTSRWCPVGWFASNTPQLSLSSPHIQILFLWGTLYELSWCRIWYWPIRSLFYLSMCELDGPPLWWCFLPGFPWWYHPRYLL